MKIVCIHCGGEFSIKAEDLGGSGRCPHCKGEIALPKPSRPEADERPTRVRPLAWLDGSISGLASLVIHMTIFLIVALWQIDGGTGGAGEGEDVLIGLLPTQELSESPADELSAAEVQKEQSTDLDTMIEVEVPATAAVASSNGEISLSTPSPSGGEAGAFDLGNVQIGGGSMGGGSWEGMIGQLRKSGLDIVLCFDSTGSMSGEINQVKRQIERIGQTLTTLVPKARISICTYRDEGDEYVTKGLPLTGSIQDVSTYLGRVSAGGGGDHPEAVDEGLYWSVSQNSFRPAARKVILLFGDAPPHPEKLKRAIEIAANFRTQNKGIVSTITCQSDTPMKEFYEIAAAGGGEAFLTTDQRQIMTQLMVLVFGSRHRDKVIEAFKLLEE
ncbi:MAG TPA: VWA domain-containing protein [Pirellulaceae bacterium]|nr:VWA domain-containing protein [Pirellulaceae bacterium]